MAVSEDERRRAIIARLHRTASEPACPPPPISTGDAAVDRATGCGGLPRGRIVELYGPESCGKTTLALLAIAALQRAGGAAAVIDADRTFDAARAASLGISLEGLVAARPASAEEAMEMASTLAASGAVDLVVIDSAAALASEAELETSLEAADGAWQAQAFWRGLRRVAAAARRGGACVLFVNQVRGGPTPQAPTTTAGGPALKIYASLRIELRAAPGGRRARLKVVRNRLGEAGGEAEFSIV